VIRGRPRAAAKSESGSGDSDRVGQARPEPPAGPHGYSATRWRQGAAVAGAAVVEATEMLDDAHLRFSFYWWFSAACRAESVIRSRRKHSARSSAADLPAAEVTCRATRVVGRGVQVNWDSSGSAGSRTEP
jgi:hypothetical protein